MSWKCSICGYQPENQKTAVTDGYCPKCEKYHVLERFDPLNDEVQKSSMPEIVRIPCCGNCRFNKSLHIYNKVDCRKGYKSKGFNHYICADYSDELGHFYLFPKKFKGVIEILKKLIK